MDDNAGDVGQLLADRYRLLLSPAEAEDAMQWRAYDTAAGQEVLVRQVPLPEVVEAELVDDEPDGGGAAVRRGGAATARRTGGRATRRPADPGVRRALEAALAASQLPDHPRLDQVFDVFVEGDGLWIVSELLPARPLASLLAERPLSPHRAAEIGADLLAALRAVHAQGWTHRNVTARTVLVCDDGHAMLTGLAAGAAEETLCGYDVLPPPRGEAAAAAGREPAGPASGAGAFGRPAAGRGGGVPPQAESGSDASPATRGTDVPPPRGGGTAAEPAGAGSGRPRDADARPPEDADGGSGSPSGGFAGPRAAALGEESAQPGSGRSRDADALRPEDAGGGTAAEPAGPGSGRPRDADSWPPEGAGGSGAPEGGFAGPRAAGPGQQPVSPASGGDGPARAGEAHATDGTSWWQVGASADSGAADTAAAGEAGERRDTAWWQTGPERGEAADAGPGRPVRGAPWDSRASGAGGGDAHAYAGEPGAPAYGAAEHGPGRPEEADDPAGRAARRGAIAAFHAGTQDASRRDTGRRSFRAAEGADEARPGSADIWADEDADDERWPFAPPRDSAPPRPTAPRSAKAEWWPFDELPDDGDTAAGPPPQPATPKSGGEWWPFDEEWDAATRTPPLPAGWEPAARGGTAADAPVSASSGSRSASRGAERARDARLTMVGAVTERWAPEQAGSAQPVGPAADLWALGALLFRAVQGRAPYPEEAAAELVESVRVGPPAAVEACGPLQAVVESLLLPDPAQRCDEQELRHRLLTLVRSAPEPEVGRHTLVGPPSLAPGGPADPRRLPIVRRRGELVRRRRAAKRPKRSGPAKPARQPRASKPADLRKQPPLAPAARPAAPPPAARRRPAASPAPRPRRPRRAGSPRSLGRLLVGLVLLLLTGAVLYAMWFMPKQGATGDDGLRQERGSVGGGPAPQESSAAPSRTPSPANTPEPKVSRTQEVPSGFDLYDAPSGFRIAVPDGWHHSGVNSRGQVRFDQGDFEMLVVKGRDSTEEFGGDPMAYQSDDEPELKPYRTSDWATATGLRRIDVGGHAMAEGTFTWKDSSGREVYVRNRALILDGRYHLVLVIGPADERKKVDRYFEGAVDTYRVLRR